MPPRDQLHELYEQHRHAVWNAAWHLCADAGLAEDVVHDVFVGLVGRDLAAIQQPRAYLLQSVVHRVRDVLRKKAPERCDALDELAADAPSAEVLAMAGECAAMVARALAGLSLEQREVVVLHVFEEMTFREVAAAVGASPNTVASRWRYAAAHLRDRLQRSGVTT